MKTRIFILDDDTDDLEIIRLELEKAGFNSVTKFKSIEELLEKIDYSTKLVIVDYRLGGIKNGADAATIIKQHCKKCHFIFISGYKLSPDEYEYLINTCGCNAIARKDDLHTLVFHVKKVHKEIEDEVAEALEIHNEIRGLLDKIEGNNGRDTDNLE